MSIYLSGAVRGQLQAAQYQLDRHTPSIRDGCCVRCGEDGPCAQRRAALRVFGRYGRLPRRWPGSSRPELIRTPVAWYGWLARVVPDERLND